MIVALTDEAKTDLERIGDFIAADNPGGLKHSSANYLIDV